MCEGIEEHYQRMNELGGGGGGLEDKLNVAMVIGMCDYDEKMEEMLETGTYRKLKEDSTATPGEWLCYHLLLSLPPLFSTTHPPSCLPLSFHPLHRYVAILQSCCSPQVRRQRAEART